ncbi:MAG: histidine phosphatase family protein [Pseudomonadota bacterium]
MRKLILLRHAKSSWDDPVLEDHDRPLNKRGHAAAPVIGEWLKYRHHKPDFVLCSSAKRTQETVQRLRKVMDGLPEPLVERGLYHASPADMLARLQQLPASVGSVLLVGHQPGLGALTRKLSDGRENRRCRRAFEHFPTAAAAVLEFDADWSALDYATARFVDFAKPRELMDA